MLRQTPGPGQDGEQRACGGVPGGGVARLLDWQALLEALAAGGFLDGDDEDRDPAPAGRMSAPLPAGQLAAMAVEHMAPGPAMAGWLGEARRDITTLDESGLVGVLISARQQASWAQAIELVAAALLAARCAAADRDIGLAADGRPVRVCRDAIGQLGLALGLSDYGAADLAHLAVTLTWRLPATGEALAEGRLDLYRARLIAEATGVLSDDAARMVEAAVLPEAWQQTSAQLRARLRRAVIAADPEAAERRRAEAERHASVSLYPDHDGTATLSGTGLPQAQAAAAMARITAIAKAMKQATKAGNLDLLRAQVMIGLLLGTLPGPLPSGGDPPSSDNPGPGHPPPPEDLPAPRDEDAPPDDGIDNTGEGARLWGDDADGDERAAAGPTPSWPELGLLPRGLGRPAAAADGRPIPGLLDVALPWETLAGFPGGGPGILGRVGPVTPMQARELARAADHDHTAQWRIIVTNASGQAVAVTKLQGRGRAGPACQARAGPDRALPASGTGLVGRVTLTVSQDVIREFRHCASGEDRASGRLSPLAAAALAAAVDALDHALARAGADAAAGGCAHTEESAAYRPPPRLREYVIARDVTCRFKTCRQPAWHADLDHTIPYGQDGRTCRCNLGGRCRKHHILKQHPRWKLEQRRAGEFVWTTPAGRTYSVGPDSYPL